MEKRRRKMVGRLDTSNPEPQWHKTIYLDGDVIRETVHDGSFSPSPQEPTLVFVPAQFCGEIIGMKGDSHNPTQYLENGENCLATAFISKVEQQVSAVDIVLDDNQYQAVSKSRVLINDNTIGDYSQDFQAYLEQYKGTSQIVVAATELESALENGSHTIKVEYNEEESETMTFTVVPDYMYFEAVQANSTVSMVSTLETAPNLEYSTDGVTFQEWQHTTADGAHTFDTLTLTAVGDRVYLRGDNPNGLADIENEMFSNISMSGKINSGGNIMSLLDKTMALTVVPTAGFMLLFGTFEEGQESDTALLTPPAMDTITSIGDAGCYSMYSGCTSLTSAADMPLLTSIGGYGCYGMYGDCTFNMSNDGTTLNFDFPTPPITAGETTYSTAYEIAEWMGNTNGFTTP